MLLIESISSKNIKMMQDKIILAAFDGQIVMANSLIIDLPCNELELFLACPDKVIAKPLLSPLLNRAPMPAGAP